MTDDLADDDRANDDRANDDLAGTVSWRELLAEAEGRLRTGRVDAADVSARRIVEEASGFDGADLGPNLGELATVRGVAKLDAMVARRIAGEPLQYVVGRWGFRHLDLMVDERVLIPRPETEEVAGWAIDELRRLARPAGANVVDLGTGSGAIGLSFLAELDDVNVWLTDRSADSLAVARANLIGLSRRAARGRVVEGSWFDALPSDLEGRVDVVVSNPPYVAAGETLPPEVADWEPSGALVAGDAGDEDVRHLIEASPRWLTPDGVVILEMAPSQTDPAADLARAFYREVEIRTDLSGRQRALIARFPVHEATEPM